jgi:hypothetical protein
LGAMTECDHDWRLYGEVGLVLYDEQLRWRRCSKCGLIGHTKKPTFARDRVKPPKVFVYKCSTPGCEGLAVHRLKGRSSHGQWRWACREHAPLS